MDPWPQSTPSGRLTVRPPRAADLAAVFAIHGDPRTNRLNPAGPDRDLAQSARRLEGWLADWAESATGYWVVERAGPADVVGFAGVRPAEWLGHAVLNLYYRFSADHWGRGYATEVARHAVAWARTTSPTRPVLAYTTSDNTASRRTALAAGLHRRPELEHELNGLPAVVFTDVPV